MSPPNEAEIAEIFRQKLEGDLPGADLLLVAQLVAGATGAMAEGWVHEAREAARRESRAMTIDDLIRAAAPPERRKWAETNRIAIHEAGHVVAHMSYGHVVSRVSIVSTEHTSGHTVTELDGLCLTAAELETVAVTSLAGRAAEIVLLGCPSAGAEGDLAQATRILAAAHASFGLGGGDIAHLVPSGGAASALLRDAKLRADVSQKLASLQANAVELIRSRRHQVEALAEALITRRALSGADAEIVVRNAKSSAKSVVERVLL